MTISPAHRGDRGGGGYRIRTSGTSERSGPPHDGIKAMFHTDGNCHMKMLIRLPTIRGGDRANQAAGHGTLLIETTGGDPYDNVQKVRRRRRQHLVHSSRSPPFQC